MKKRYKIVLNIEIEDPEKPFPAGGYYTLKNRIEGIVSLLLAPINWPGIIATITLDKLIDKGEI